MRTITTIIIRLDSVIKRIVWFIERIFVYFLLLYFPMCLFLYIQLKDDFSDVIFLFPFILPWISFANSSNGTNYCRWNLHWNFWRLYFYKINWKCSVSILHIIIYIRQSIKLCPGDQNIKIFYLLSF